MDILRDQFWNGVSAIAALITVVISVIVERERLRPLGLHIFAVLVCAFAGIVVLATGPLVQSMFQFTFESGLPAMWGRVVTAFTEHGSEVVASLMTFGIFPGTVTAMVALSGKGHRQKVKRAIIAATATLIVFDTIVYAVGGANKSIGYYFFAILSDFVGGPLAGYIIGSITEFIMKQFQSE
jgi:hypothetical protein